ncbi:mutator type transposase, partial [Tanacetum coccineum]
MKLQWRGEQYKDLLWRSATATTVQRFGKNMEEIKKFDPEMYKWLKDKWLKKSRILNCRKTPLEYLMKRIVIVQGIIGKSTGPLTPNATKIFNVIKRDAASIRSYGIEETFACIWDMANNGLEPGIPESYTLITLTPPNYKPPVGRPRKKRRKSAAEIYDNLVKKGKLSRAGKTVTCLKCGQQGHNKRSCKGQRQKGSASGSHAPPQAPSQTTTHASAQAPQSSTQPSQAPQSSTQPSQAPQSSTQPLQASQSSNRFTKSIANRLSPLKKKFVGPRHAATQKNGVSKPTAATKKKDVSKAK